MKTGLVTTPETSCISAYPRQWMLFYWSYLYRFNREATVTNL